MRPYKLMALACLSFTILMTGCAEKDDDCGQTSGCVPPPETCGDDACQANEGENAANCPEDCVPETCGDGACSAEDHETPDNCPEDCNVTCLDPDKPVYCEVSNSCWPAGTDCDVQNYECGGEVHLCSSTQYAFNCCDGMAFGCLKDTPYRCPAIDRCVETPEECPGGAEACSVWAAACGPL